MSFIKTVTNQYADYPACNQGTTGLDKRMEKLDNIYQNSFSASNIVRTMVLI